jgi:hypothetical protein
MKIKQLGSVTDVSSCQTGQVDFNAVAVDENVKDVRVHLTCKHDHLFNIVPNSSMPYTISALDVGDERGQDLPFTITPLNAEPGKTYEFELHYSWKNCGDKKGTEYRDVKRIRVPVYASDSTYFAIGMAKALQEKSEKFYMEMKDKGLEAQNNRWALFGGHDIDPGRVAVSEQSFNWAMSLVELGSRIYRTQVETVKKSDQAAAAAADSDPADRNQPADGAGGDGDS